MVLLKNALLIMGIYSGRVFYSNRIRILSQGDDLNCTGNYRR